MYVDMFDGGGDGEEEEAWSSDDDDDFADRCLDYCRYYPPGYGPPGPRRRSIGGSMSEW